MIEAVRTYDKELVKSIVTNPQIFKAVSDDCIKPSDYEPDVNDQCWLNMRTKDGCVGVYNYHARNATTLEIHAHVLPEHRLKWARYTGWAALEWALSCAPSNYSKIVVSIPSVYPKVVNFTSKFGFQHEGVNRLCDRVDGVLCDQIMLGITFDEIKTNLGGFYAKS